VSDVCLFDTVCLSVCRVHGAHSYWKQGALGAAGVWRVWAGAGPQRAARYVNSLTWHHQAVELVREIGRRTANITGDARESTFLFQQLSVALQRGNAVSFQNTFTAS